MPQDNLNPTNPPVPPMGGATNQPPAVPVPPATWEAYLEAQPADVKVLYEAHTTGLRNSVQATRAERDASAQQVAEIQRVWGKDPVEAKRLFDKMTTDLESERLRADFSDAAIKVEIGCSNPRAAFLIAHDIGAIGARGRIDWDAIKAAAPELFQKRAPDGRAGVGTGSSPVTKVDMNSLIRRAAGRQP